MLVDIGANLTSSRFNKDRAQVINNAVEAGVDKIIVTGSDFESNQAASELCQQYPDNLLATAGCHPHHASECNQAYIEQIKQLHQQPWVKAVGECGLDFNRNYSPQPQQKATFEAQLQLAVELNKPVFLHQRDAHHEFLEILKPYLPKLKSACLHCFTGNERELSEYIELGLYVGITGWICDERRGQELKQIVHLIPKGKLMIETDSPYLLPRDLRPKPKSSRNLPQYLPHIAKEVAHCRNESVENLIQHTYEASKQFFQF